jgi:hypothetical protein
MTHTVRGASPHRIGLHERSTQVCENEFLRRPFEYTHLFSTG